MIIELVVLVKSGSATMVAYGNNLLVDATEMARCSPKNKRAVVKA